MQIKIITIIIIIKETLRSGGCELTLTCMVAHFRVTPDGIFAAGYYSFCQKNVRRKTYNRKKKKKKARSLDG
jgi:hypothetical protein